MLDTAGRNDSRVLSCPPVLSSNHLPFSPAFTLPPFGHPGIRQHWQRWVQLPDSANSCSSSHVQGGPQLAQHAQG